MSVRSLLPRVFNRRFSSAAAKIFLSLCAVAFITLAPNGALAAKTADVCTVRTFWTSRLNKVRDNTYLLGEFRPTLENDGYTEKYYKHKETGYTISVGVIYDDGYDDGFSGKATEIKLAVAVSGAEQHAFDSPDAALAGADYRKGRLNLYAEKRVVVGDFIYSFVLDCRAVKK